MDKAKKILIEFSWRGHKISQFVEQYAIFKDIKGEGFKTLKAEQKVVFDVENTDRGQKAVNVEVIE